MAWASPKKKSNFIRKGKGIVSRPRRGAGSATSTEFRGGIGNDERKFHVIILDRLQGR